MWTKINYFALKDTRKITMDSNKFICSKCSKECYFIDVTKSKDIKELFGCACDLCKKVYCRECHHFGANEIRVLCSKSKSLIFFCEHCYDLINATVEDLPNINKRISNLERETKELKDSQRKIIDNVPTYAQVVADTTSLKKQVEDLTNEVSIQKTTPAISTSTNTVSIEPTLCELAEREKRVSNVLIFGVPEANASENQPDADLKKAAKVVTNLKINIDEKQLRVYRLGTPMQDKVRPIKVICPSPSIAREILKLKKNMSKEEKIYIKSDQTPLQRSYLKQVLKDLEDRKQKGEVDLRIKYINNVPKIITSQHQAKN